MIIHNNFKTMRCLEFCYYFLAMIIALEYESEVTLRPKQAVLLL